ncbi:MAG: hypothetical protein IJ669_02305, partial [Prevotella sp.]|nr:hypothetical protein [Prevotella sp.]
MRPPGYEPGELPTAPLRDVSYFVAAKVYIILFMCKYFLSFFIISYVFSFFFRFKSYFLQLYSPFCCVFSSL